MFKHNNNNNNKQDLNISHDQAVPNGCVVSREVMSQNLQSESPQLVPVTPLLLTAVTLHCPVLLLSHRLAPPSVSTYSKWPSLLSHVGSS